MGGRHARTGAWARRAIRNLEAEDADQVHVNLHKNLDQPGGQISEHARECMPRIVIQRVVVGKRVVLLGDGEDV